jgi:ribosomal protein S18 acetylase RimI-like enzyme
MLRNILDSCLGEVDIEEVCLHVCVSNQKALNLYKSNGFSIEMILRGYYELNAGVVPPDAYLLKKAIPNNVLQSRIKQL